jgi:D-alanine--poly(phosphoribitol) ligase subunit 2
MAHDLADIRKLLKEHIEGEILLRKTPLSPDEDLFNAGFDSMSLTRVQVFVEEQLGLKIPDQDIVPDELSTLEKWARFVHERLAAAGR